MMCDGTSEESFPSPRRTVKEHTLRLGDSQAFKNFRVLDGKLNDFLNFFDLLRNVNATVE